MSAALRRPWLALLLVAAAVGVLSLLTNIITIAELSGEANTWLGIRTTITRLVNAGTVWAGLGVLAGWLVRRPLPALAAGPLTGVTALAVHYGVGMLTGLMPGNPFADNAYWFVAAVLIGVPLGLVGVMAHRRDRWGGGARLVVPFGALAEPWVQGWIPGFADDSAPMRWSGWVAGVVLIAAGAWGVAVVRRGVRARSTLRMPRADSPVGSPPAPGPLATSEGRCQSHR